VTTKTIVSPQNTYSPSWRVKRILYQQHGARNEPTNKWFANVCIGPDSLVISFIQLLFSISNRDGIFKLSDFPSVNIYLSIFRITRRHCERKRCLILEEVKIRRHLTRQERFSDTVCAPYVRCAPQGVPWHYKKEITTSS